MVGCLFALTPLPLPKTAGFGSSSPTTKCRRGGDMILINILFFVQTDRKYIFLIRTWNCENTFRHHTLCLLSLLLLFFFFWNKETRLSRLALTHMHTCTHTCVQLPLPLPLSPCLLGWSLSLGPVHCRPWTWLTNAQSPAFLLQAGAKLSRFVQLFTSSCYY